LKQQYDDAVAWQHGVYIKLAIGSCFDKATKFPKRPMMSNAQQEEDAETRQKRIKEKMMQQMTLINSRFRKEE